VVDGVAHLDWALTRQPHRTADFPRRPLTARYCGAAARLHPWPRTPHSLALGAFHDHSPDTASATIATTAADSQGHGPALIGLTGCGVRRTAMSSTADSTSSRGQRSVSTGSCAPTVSTGSALVNAAFSMRSVADRTAAPALRGDRGGLDGGLRHRWMVRVRRCVELRRDLDGGEGLHAARRGH
jgi:hypothetical protein